MTTVVSLGFSLSPVTTAFASSVYDNAVNVASPLYMRWCLDGSWGNCAYVLQSPSTPVEKTIAYAMKHGCTSTIWSSFQTALKDGDWTIAQDGAGVVRVIWSQVHTTAHFAGNDSYYGSGHYGLRVGGAMDGDYTPFWMVEVYGMQYGAYNCDVGFTNNVGYSPIDLTSDYDASSPRLWLSTFAVANPIGYEGAAIPFQLTDSDGDGLSAAKEAGQGTSDGSIDTDGDGLSDDTESIWNTNRENEFCDTSTPKNCAYPDPIKKDLYVQVDWLDDGTISYKPTSTQLGLVSASYAALGINFHVDTGDYGGGNAISVNDATDVTTIPGDFYHHKYGNGIFEPASFDVANRYKIWHYMISGYNFDDGTSGSTTLSGIAESGGDDIFMSYGLLASTRGGSTLDKAIAGSVVHELGHNLCLANYSYAGQDSSCLFGGMDSYSSSNYRSAMNYNYQFTNDYSYSDGTHGIGDHDDIVAINVGLDDFVYHDDDSGAGGP